MIIRTTRDVPYTVVSNDTLRDPRLSFKATGLLAYLLSMPDEWEPNRDHLATVKADGVRAVRSAMEELEAAGYVSRQRIKLANGTIDWLIEVRERPLTSGAKRADGRVKTSPPVARNAPVQNAPLYEVTTDEKSLAAADETAFRVAPPFEAMRASVRRKRERVA